jgi:hypothetical protein
MRSVRAVYDNGHLVFPEGSGPEGRMEVVVVFSDQGEQVPRRGKDKNAGRRFVEEWSGVLKGADIEGWKEQRIAELEKKHQ